MYSFTRFCNHVVGYLQWSEAVCLKYLRISAQPAVLCYRDTAMPTYFFVLWRNLCISIKLFGHVLQEQKERGLLNEGEL